MMDAPARPRLADRHYVPAIVRHERRILVETLMLDGARPHAILVAVREWCATKGYAPPTPFQTWRDRRWVERRWQMRDGKRLDRMRNALLARMERLEHKAAAEGHFASAASLQAWQARILGMMKPDGILLALPASVGVNTPLPEIAAEFTRVFGEQFGPPTALPDGVVDAKIVPPPSNGHANGHANGAA